MAAADHKDRTTVTGHVVVCPCKACRVRFSRERIICTGEDRNGYKFYTDAGNYAEVGRDAREERYYDD